MLNEINVLVTQKEKKTKVREEVSAGMSGIISVTHMCKLNSI